MAGVYQASWQTLPYTHFKCFSGNVPSLIRETPMGNSSCCDHQEAYTRSDYTMITTTILSIIVDQFNSTSFFLSLLLFFLLISNFLFSLTIQNLNSVSFLFLQQAVEICKICISKHFTKEKKYIQNNHYI